MLRSWLLVLLISLACSAAADPWRTEVPRSRETLREVLLGNEPVASRQAARRLGDLGPAALDSVPALSAALSRDDPELWSCVWEALSRIGPAAGPRLRALLGDGPRGARRRRAQALARLGDELAPCLEDPRAEVREAALEALLAERRPPTLLPPALELGTLRCLSDASEANRSLAREVLIGRLIDPNAPGVLPLLLSCLPGPDPQIRYEAAIYLRSHRPTESSLRALVLRLEEDEWAACRREAARTLGTLGPAARSAAPALRRLLTDSAPEVRWRSAEALAEIDASSRRTRVALLGALADLDPEAGDQVTWALTKLKPRSEVAAALVSATRWSRWRVRARATKALSLLPEGEWSESRLEALAAALTTDTDHRVREAAARGFVRLGPSAAPAVPAWGEPSATPRRKSAGSRSQPFKISGLRLYLLWTHSLRR